MKALQFKGYEAKWYDKRRSIAILNFDKIFGFILNVPSDNKIGGIISLPWKRNHWYAVTKINNSKRMSNDFKKKKEKKNFFLSFL